MGIVITVALLCALISLLWIKRFNKSALLVVSMFSILAGTWNVLWYWLRHPVSFWGLAALVSGLALLVVGLLTLQKTDHINISLISDVAIKPLLLILSVSFLLYAITIIQLNLGLPIIG